jgi:activator of HSP90 ATPase
MARSNLKNKMSGATDSKRLNGESVEHHVKRNLRRIHMSIRQEVTFPVSPERVYDLLTVSEKFAAASGMPAKIEAGEGAPFSIFGGYIQGRQIELVPGQRVVQAWRGSDWDSGTYSLVRFTLTSEGKGTRLVVDHDAYPEGASPRYPSWHEHLSANWPVFYFEPFAKYLAA